MTNELRETSRFPPDRAGVPRYPLRPIRHPGERIQIDRGDATSETAPDAVDPRCRFHSHPGRQPSNPPVLIDEGKILRVGDTATLDHDHLDTVRDTGRIPRTCRRSTSRTALPTSAPHAPPPPPDRTSSGGGRSGRPSPPLPASWRDHGISQLLTILTCTRHRQYGLRAGSRCLTVCSPLHT